MGVGYEEGELGWGVASFVGTSRERDEWLYGSLPAICDDHRSPYHDLKVLDNPI